MNYAAGNIGDVRPLSWTTKPPTVPGWYWVYTHRKGLRRYGIHIASFQYGVNKIPLVQIYSESVDIRKEPKRYDRVIDYWLGPLPIPEPPTKGKP